MLLLEGTFFCVYIIEPIESYGSLETSGGKL